MPGDEELGFEAAVAALGKFILDPFLHFCFDYIQSLFGVFSLFFPHHSCSLPVFLFLLLTVPYPALTFQSNLVSTLSVSAGMKTTVSEAEHPLLCEGTRRVKGDLALALMITYKDDQSKLKKVAVTILITLKD